MSADDSAESTPGVLTSVYRTVSPRYDAREDAEMDAVGWTMFLVLLALFLPLLPFVLVVWLVSKGFEALSDRD